MARANKYNADPEALRRAMADIGDGFDWDSTPQGLEYWEQVLQNLEGLMDQVEPLKATG